MIAVILLLADAPVITVPRAVFTDSRVLAPAPVLAWPDETVLHITERDGELVARFDRPLSPAQIETFRDAAGTAIEDLRWNDDSLVLRAAPGWRMTWQQAGTTLSTAFVPPPIAAIAGPITGPITEPTDETAPDTALAGIEADVAAGYPGQALRAATRLAERYPSDRRVTRLLADTRMADGDVRGAAQGYRSLAADDSTARRAIAAAPGTASIGITARDGSDLSQAEFAARVDAAIDNELVAGGGVRHIVSQVAAGGRTADTVIDASLLAAFANAVRVQLIASAALDDAVTGGGAKLVAGSTDAQFRVTLLRHMPDYSTPAQVLAGGYLSRALIGVTYRLTPGLVAQADLGTNRYGLAGEAGASDTVVASAGLDYLIRRQFPALGLTYRFEAEYVERMRIGLDGLAAVPLASRENHTVQGLISGSVGAVQMTGLAGWTVDRFGGDGPTASLGVAAPIGIAWRVEGSGGVTSIARPGFSGRQVFARAQVTHSLGTTR